MVSAIRVTRFRFGGRRFAAIAESAPPALPSNVSNAEREIATLLRAGLSNKEIAKARGTSARTVANQISALMRKLGVSSRVEIALAIGPAGEDG